MPKIKKTEKNIDINKLNFFELSFQSTIELLTLKLHEPKKSNDDLLLWCCELDDEMFIFKQKDVSINKKDIINFDIYAKSKRICKKALYEVNKQRLNY